VRLIKGISWETIPEIMYLESIWMSNTFWNWNELIVKEKKPCLLSGWLHHHAQNLLEKKKKIPFQLDPTLPIHNFRY